MVSELFVPHPVIWLARLHDLIFKKLVNNVDVVNDVQDQGLYLDKDQIIATVVERCVTFKLSLEIALVVLQLALLDSVDTVASEVEHL